MREKDLKLLAEAYASMNENINIPEGYYVFSHKETPLQPAGEEVVKVVNLNGKLAMQDTGVGDTYLHQNPSVVKALQDAREATPEEIEEFEAKKEMLKQSMIRQFDRL